MANPVQYVLLSVVLSAFTTFPAQNISGKIPVKVTDNRTQTPLPSAQVCIESLNKCVTVDNSGTAQINSIVPGLYTLVASLGGYDTLTIPNIQIKSGLNNIVNFTLESSNNVQELDKIVVVGRKLDQKTPEQTTSVTKINNFELSNTAGTGNDVNRVLAILPSTVSGVGQGFDNDLLVRGGRSRENVYLIDGIQFDNASHFSSVSSSGGSIGFLNSSLVQSIDFYAGGFPARMPSRLSSAIDLKLRTGSFSERKYQFDLNMSGLGLTTEGPMLKAKGSYLASLRLVDLSFLKQMLTVGGLPRYGDLQLKTVYAPSANQTIKIVGIGAFDHFSEDPENWVFGDSIAQVKYDEYLYQGGGGIFWDAGNDKARNVLGLSGTARYEQYYDDLTHLSRSPELDTFKFNNTQYITNGTIADSIIDPDNTLYIELGRYGKKRIHGTDDKRYGLNLTDDFSLYVGDQSQLNTGLFGDYQHFYIKDQQSFDGESFEIFLPDSITPTVVPGSYNTYHPYAIDSALGTMHAGGYLEFVFQQSIFKAIAGLRGDYYTLLTDYGISPRLGLSLAFPALGTFSASGGLLYQFPSEFSGLLKEIIMRSPYWPEQKVSLHDARLQRNWQYVLGYERQIGESHLLTAETYLKWYDREYPFISPGERKYGEVVDQNWKWNLDDPRGEKRAYGLELSFQKKKYDKFYYSLSYSLFQVENKYTDGKWYNDEYSIRNALGVSVGTNFLKHQSVSLRIQASEGKPYTPAVYDLTRNIWKIDTTKEYFSERLDPILSFNLRYSFNIYRAWGNITGYLEVWNFLNNKPVVERYLDANYGFIDYTTNGFLPVAGFTVDF